MIVFEILDTHETLLLILLKFLFPLTIKLLKLLITNVNIFSELVFLDVSTELILVLVNICLKKTHFAHEILIESILLHVA